MVSRVWVGLGVLLLGVVGLLAGWWIDTGGGQAGVLAALAVFAVAAGALLAASAGGEVPVRATGGLLFMAGLAVIITHHQVWWWLPTSWQTPVSVAALIIAVVGLAVMLLAYGFSLAGLSGALGLLALTCLALTLTPYIGSEEQSVLRAFATALGSVALTAGVGAAAGVGGTADGAAAGVARRTRVDWHAMTAVAGVVGAAVTVYAGYDSYDVYAPGGHHAAVIGAAVGGAVASLALGAVIAWSSITGRLTRTSRSAGRTPGPVTAEPAPVPAPPHQPPHEPPPHEPAGAVTAPAASTVVTARPAATTTTSASAVSTAPSADTSTRLRDRLQTASVAVGLVIGIITIAKEVIGAALAIIH